MIQTAEAIVPNCPLAIVENKIRLMKLSNRASGFFITILIGSGGYWIWITTISM